MRKEVWIRRLTRLKAPEQKLKGSRGRNKQAVAFSFDKFADALSFGIGACYNRATPGLVIRFMLDACASLKGV